MDETPDGEDKDDDDVQIDCITQKITFIRIYNANKSELNMRYLKVCWCNHVHYIL